MKRKKNSCWLRDFIVIAMSLTPRSIFCSWFLVAYKGIVIQSKAYVGHCYIILELQKSNFKIDGYVKGKFHTSLHVSMTLGVKKYNFWHDYLSKIEAIFENALASQLVAQVGWISERKKLRGGGFLWHCSFKKEYESGKVKGRKHGKKE